MIIYIWRLLLRDYYLKISLLFKFYTKKFNVFLAILGTQIIIFVNSLFLDDYDMKFCCL